MTYKSAYERCGEKASEKRSRAILGEMRRFDLGDAHLRGVIKLAARDPFNFDQYPEIDHMWRLREWARNIVKEYKHEGVDA